MIAMHIVRRALALVLLASMIGCERSPAEQGLSLEHSYLYDVHMTSRSEVSGVQVGPGQANDFTFELSGTLSVHAARARGGARRAGAVAQGPGSERAR